MWSLNSPLESQHVEHIEVEKKPRKSSTAIATTYEYHIKGKSLEPER